MPTNDNQTLERELTQAIDALQAALQQASDATASIRALVPRVGAIGTLFTELDAVIRTGREQFGAAETPAYTRPTLVVPTEAPRPATAPATMTTDQVRQAIESRPTQAEPSNRDLVSFRLEFESKPGPLDLRTVDDAVSEHPAVRDVALLDYDGRKATLKVWIDSDASPSDVQAALTEKTAQLFPGENDVTIVALEDVA
jgi:hypothetical protein